MPEIINSINKNFESIKKLDENGVEYWEARELLLLLGYEKWQNAEEVISRAGKACMNSGQTVDNHFTAFSKMAKIGLNSVREVRNWKLDRYACYLVAQNGDPKKPEIALAQTYFAIQTRKQEIFGQLSEADKRLFIRGEVSEENKKLFSTAKRAGVTKFGSFNDAGYRGLYGMPLDKIEVIPSPINLFPPSPVTFGQDFDKNSQLIPISIKFFSKSCLESPEDLWEHLNWR